MSSSRVLQPHPVVELDSLSACMGQRQFLYQSLIRTPLKPAQRFCPPTDYPQRTSLRSVHFSSSCVPTMPQSCFCKKNSRVHGKRVVFADDLGLPLTVEHLFTPEPYSPTPKRQCPRHLEGQQNPANKLLLPRFRLGFPQPTKELEKFVAHLQKTCIQMESCNVSESTLSGEVCVFHSSQKKTVYIKVTYDSWMSHKDIPCKFLEHRLCHGLDVDVFYFEVNLPQKTDQNERMEFCFTFSPGHNSALHWDDNMGQNYKVIEEKARSCAGKVYTKSFYPLLSKYKPPVCSQLSSCLQNCHDLKYLQSHLLSSRTLGALKYAFH
ncbi:protein phosphatase 1 regulatory subunit 3C [Girardinichthys multiradiatus]|uniref:protein phosphatase 1 regulatory subunit 3C n=1 Tax=Girardinichthys multiradiatus TaxID=208333 RepID=UPI001FAD6FAA|nr:protein phosphatase 1 regulatory subunit 3C [Girardinichthys multiradiatus]